MEEFAGIDAAAIGERLRARRTALGLSQRALAQSAGVTTAFISSIERGERLPSLETLARLCVCPGLSLDALALGRQPCDANHCPLADAVRRALETCAP